MKVVLHIGQSKTGTSAIQTFLSLNRAALLEQGVLYPNISIWGVPLDMLNHNPVADAISGRLMFPNLSAAQYRSAFFDQARKHGASQMILSAEHFFGGEPRVWHVNSEDEYFAQYREKVRRLKDWLQWDDMDVVVYLRPHASWFASAVAQTIRTAGFTRETYANRTDIEFIDLYRPVLRYERLLSVWRDILTPSTLQVIPYRRGDLINGNSVTDFIHRIGIDPHRSYATPPELEANTSLTREYLEVKRRLNSRKLSKVEVRTAIKCLEALSRSSSEPSAYTLDPDAKIAVDQIAEDDNRALFGSFGTSIKPDTTPAPARDLTTKDVDFAFHRFSEAMKTPQFRQLRVKLWAKSVLRRRAMPLHVIMHRLKRLSHIGR